MRGGVHLERRAQSRLYGRLMAAAHRHERPKAYDDVTLAHKVETVLFRDAQVPKGRLNIDACEGVVTLRGTIDETELIEHIVERVRRIQGVRSVESLLHTPGTPPPQRHHRAHTPARQPA